MLCPCHVKLRRKSNHSVMKLVGLHIFLMLQCMLKRQMYMYLPHRGDKQFNLIDTRCQNTTGWQKLLRLLLLAQHKTWKICQYNIQHRWLGTAVISKLPTSTKPVRDNHGGTGSFEQQNPISPFKVLREVLSNFCLTWKDCYGDRLL